MLADAELAGEQRGRQMVGGHELDGGGCKDANAVQFTVVGQHLRKAVVVVDGGGKRAATLGIGGLGGVVEGDSVGRGFGDKLAIGFVIADGKAGALVGRAWIATSVMPSGAKMWSRMKSGSDWPLSFSTM